VTYSARDLEPYRGFHVFMRALPRVLEQRPRAQVLIVGGDGVSYGRRPEKADSYPAQLLAELDGKVDLKRCTFSGTFRTSSTSRFCRSPQFTYISPIRLCFPGRSWRRWRLDVSSSALAQRQSRR